MATTIAINILVLIFLEVHVYMNLKDKRILKENHITQLEVGDVEEDNYQL